MPVVVRGAFNQDGDQGEMSLPTIPKTNQLSNPEKELRRLCDDALVDIDVLKLSQQELGKEKIFEALRLNGYHRINEASHRKKRDELLSMRAKALYYKNAYASSDTDLSALTLTERNLITQYQFKSLPTIDNRIETVKYEEVEITRQLNELNRLHYINLKEQQFLSDIRKDVKYNINGDFILMCIDLFMSSLHNHAQNHHIIREENKVVDDRIPHRAVRIESGRALLGSDLNENGEMDS
jgi:hypothetical protein